MTPLIEISALGFGRGTRVFAKCENHNPISFSHYDRIYRHLFDRGLADGSIIPGETHLFETSSGNAGTAFARFCDLYGIEGTIVFPASVRPQRLASIDSRHVTVVVSPYDGYMKGALRALAERVNICKRAGGKPHFINHSQTWESVVAFQPCGEEIHAQFQTLGLRPDIFITALGNGTSTSGIGLPLKAHYPNLKLVGFEPRSSPVYSVKAGLHCDTDYAVTPLTGTGAWGINFPNLDVSMLSRIELIDDGVGGETIWEPLLDQVENLFGESIGLTSGVAIHVARILSAEAANQIIVLPFYDIHEYYR